MDFQYKEILGAEHGPVIEQGMADIFAFFASRRKPAASREFQGKHSKHWMVEHRDIGFPGDSG
jgi:hypothetical protein